jgi:hypothetical protein
LEGISTLGTNDISKIRDANTVNGLNSSNYLVSIVLDSIVEDGFETLIVIGITPLYIHACCIISCIRCRHRYFIVKIGELEGIAGVCFRRSANQIFFITFE